MNSHSFFMITLIYKYFVASLNCWCYTEFSSIEQMFRMIWLVLDHCQLALVPLVLESGRSRHKRHWIVHLVCILDHRFLIQVTCWVCHIAFCSIVFHEQLCGMWQCLLMLPKWHKFSFFNLMFKVSIVVFKVECGFSTGDFLLL